MVGTLALAACSQHESAPAPPKDVTFTGMDDAALRARVGEVIAEIRKRDAAGLAHLDIDDTGRRGGPDADKGAAWLVRYFAEPLKGVVQAEIDREQNGPLVQVCLNYGKPRHQLMLDFNDYGKKGESVDGGNGLWPFSARRFAEVADQPPKTKTIPGTFCESGHI
ncbi:hypothetical protein [Actinomadura chibensis]|uniref:Uncharacterized protein n=1 Tax=Actinomadura chibensis TaxID=392828 RepID=A0A5D0NQS4_9ACTN|nr:hypothetical protein [Actinomadura chibensis]TYB46642.1 hypothetical protein FXF69_15620 [Actinomadura chibensis]